jgi:hypothetical protein
VSFDFFDRRSAERFAELLDETNGGRRHHSRNAADDGRLDELAALGRRLSATPVGMHVDPEFTMGLRAMLVATAERDGIGVTAEADEPVARTGRSLLGRGSARRIRARGAIVIGVAAGAMAVSGISAASESAAPGDALYGVKRSTERAQLAMAGSDVNKGQLSLDFAKTRLAEAAKMNGADPGFDGVLDDMDNDTKAGVRLLTSSAVSRRSVNPLKDVDTFVTGQRGVLTPRLEKLSPDNRERALASLALLDDVHQRAADLRTGLGCDTVTPDGTDSLGPKLQDCMTGSDNSSTSERQQGQGESEKHGKGTGSGSTKSKPGPTDPTAGPDKTGGVAPDGSTTTPYLAPSSGAATTPSGGRTTGPADDPDDSEDDDEGVIGGILGGIFG